MFACIWYGMPRENDQHGAAARPRLARPRLFRLGFALLYAGLDQGNRLDWSNNGLVDGLLLAGGLLTLAFVVRELRRARSRSSICGCCCAATCRSCMLLLAGFRFIILSTAYIIPTYLQAVQNFRELQVGRGAALDRAAATR